MAKHDFKVFKNKTTSEPPQPGKKLVASLLSVMKDGQEYQSIIDFLPKDGALRDDLQSAISVNGWTTPILQDAVRWLVTLGSCKPVSARTVYDWYLKEEPETDTQLSFTVTA